MAESLKALFTELLRPCPPRDALLRGRRQLEDALNQQPDSTVGPSLEWSIDLSEAEHLKAPNLQLQFIQGLGAVWLSGLGQPALATGIVEGILFQLYCRSLDQDELIGMKPPNYFHDQPIRSSTFQLVLTLLTLRHYPQSFLPEILGVTLAACSLTGLRMPLPKDARELALEALNEARSQDWDEHRIGRGTALYQCLMRNIAADLKDPLPLLTHHDAFAEVIRKKARGAKGYHANIRVEGKPLDEWFDEASIDPEKLMMALASSRFVEAGCPNRSRLIQAMDFGGPMFGVFDDDERTRAKRWIEDPSDISRGPDPRPPATAVETSVIPPLAPRPSPSGLRELFHQLIHSENPAESPEESLQLIRRILRRTRWLRRLGLLPNAFHYDPESLDQFLEQTHHEALKPKARRFKNRALSRKDWIWILTQLSPSVLIDGAWLSGVPNAFSLMQPWHLKLLRIHEDELGRGDPQKNHPRVYRRLLESLKVEVAEVTDLGFALNPEINTVAFQFAAYMAAIGLHFHTFEPECLGLNLAIEISGLGAGYQNIIRDLRGHGIDPMIAELHLSIDNLDSGHARIARDAIVLYLESVAQREGEKAQQAAWQRIQLGYLSYGVALSGMGLLFLWRWLFSSRLTR